MTNMLLVQIEEIKKQYEGKELIFVPGLRGPPGVNGEKGERGYVGVRGAKGEQGRFGVAGPRGLQGNKGAMGPIGLPVS